ncbi:MAG TPA: hypothetical protein DD459_10560 [Halieaceae bacterium]|nr:hypothetical protein [Halieaceae bacterium]
MSRVLHLRHVAARLKQQANSSRVLRAGFLASLVRGTGLLITFGLQLLLARLIGDATHYGLYAWGQNLLFLLGAIFAIGIPLASSRLIAVHHARGDLDTASRVAWHSTGWLLVTCALGIAGVTALVLAMPAELFVDFPRALILLAVFAAPLVSFTTLLQAHARAKGRLLLAFGPTQVLRPLFTALIAGVVVFWVGFQLGAMEAMLSLAGSLLLVLLLQCVMVACTGRRNGPLPASEPLAEEGNYAPAQLMHNALPLFATRCATLTMQYSSTLLLGILGGPAIAASFFVADRLARLGAIPGTVVAAVVQPWLASAYAERQHEKLQAVVTEASHVSLWPTLLGCVLLYFAAPFLVGLFGAEYQGALEVLGILLLGYVAGASLGPSQQMLVMSGHQRVLMHIMTLSALVHILTLILLIPNFGATGAAAATLVSTTLARSLCLVIVRRRLGLQPSALVHLAQRLRHKEPLS